MAEITEEPYPDYTKEFFNLLYFDPKEVWKGVTKKNHIKTLPIIVLGTGGIGKTTFVENIMLKVSNWYYNQGVCPVYTNQVSLGSLMEYGLQTFRWLGEKWKHTGAKNPEGGGLPQVYVLGFDDATAVKVKRDEIRRFFSIRHVAQQHSGITEGIIYTVFLTHDWYSLSRIFRRYGIVAVVLSVPPLDEYSRNQVARMLGEEAVEILEEAFKKAMKEDKYKGIGFVRLPYVPKGQRTKIGMIRFKEVDVAYVKVEHHEKPEVEVDRASLVLHIPEPKKKQAEEEDVVTSYESFKEKERKRVKKYRARKKAEYEKAKRKKASKDKQAGGEVQ